MNKSVTTLFNFIFCVCIAVTLLSCSDESTVEPEPEPNPPEEQPPEIGNTEPVPADGVLEAVTWNIECYGVDSFCADGEINKQTKNIVTIVDTLNADLYALQELADQEALTRIVTNMTDYKGIVAKDMVGTQITGFVYNTNVIEALSSGLIKIGDPGDWASSKYTRYPFYFKFVYHSETTADTLYAVVIHAEAGDSRRDYESRQNAAQSLYNYFTKNKPDANVILLGDYNDDVDVSIYKDEVSPYKPFITHNKQFKVVTKLISNNHQTTYLGYPDAIDHITISNELFDNYISKSAEAFTKAIELIGGESVYERTTTGHIPVWAKFEF